MTVLPWLFECEAQIKDNRARSASGCVTHREWFGKNFGQDFKYRCLCEDASKMMAYARINLCGAFTFVYRLRSEAFRFLSILCWTLVAEMKARS